eukprot:11174787-Lingulodinium_polyedra.AAC.1
MSKSYLIQRKRPSKVFSVGGLRSRRVMDLYTDSASMVSVTSSKSPTRSLTPLSAPGVRIPFSNSRNVTNVG